MTKTPNANDTDLISGFNIKLNDGIKYGNTSAEKGSGALLINTFRQFNHTGCCKHSIEIAYSPGKNHAMI